MSGEKRTFSLPEDWSILQVEPFAHDNKAAVENPLALRAVREFGKAPAFKSWPPEEIINYLSSLSRTGVLFINPEQGGIALFVEATEPCTGACESRVSGDVESYILMNNNANSLSYSVGLKDDDLVMEVLFPPNTDLGPGREVAELVASTIRDSAGPSSTHFGSSLPVGSGPNMRCRDFLILDAAAASKAWAEAAKAADRPEIATAAAMLNGISVCQDQTDSGIVDVAKRVSRY